MFGRTKTSLDKGLDAFARKEYGRARRLLEDAMMDGERAAAAYHLGLLYWKGLGGDRDQRAAVDLFARAAGDGHTAAQAAYGMALKSGVGTPQNLDAARSVLRSSAGAGNADAMAALAEISGPEDARRWLTRACEHGHAPAMRALADLIMQDDPVEALAWLYADVSLSGDAKAAERAEKLAREMSADEIAQAQRLGKRFAKASRKGRRR